MKKRTPTGHQAKTLERLMTGWELVIGVWADACPAPYGGTERIFWRKTDPVFGYDTLDCGYPKLKRHAMSLLERYGWVDKHPTGWTVTQLGREAQQRWTAWFKAACAASSSFSTKGQT